MNEYSVTVLVDASRSYTVKAESPEAAIEQAEELYSGESSGLCHHCSGKLDVGGAVGAIAYCEDKEVLDTSYQAARIAALEAEYERLKNSLLEITARRFAESWKKRTSDAELEQYLSAGIAQLEAERDTLRAELEQSRELIIEMSKHCNATALVANWLGHNI